MLPYKAKSKQILIFGFAENYSAKPKGSIFLLVKWADTVVWLWGAAASTYLQNIMYIYKDACVCQF